ncbi:SpoIIE family protein phosphatase [Streptomyces sp. NPDC096354]|uniref:ATP-binding SpoIIE family protein phosphatase n=1 Tax=Streptomyces sp. NPDC096354 TaxID=3366088 RepID=UPI00382360F1
MSQILPPHSRRAFLSASAAATAEAVAGSFSLFPVTPAAAAERGVPLLADYATVDLLDSTPSGEEPPSRLSTQEGPVPVFRRAALASIHPGIPEALFERGEPVFVPPASPLTGGLRSGESPFVLVDTSPGTWLDCHDATRAEKVREHAMHSLMVVPIRTRGAVLGVAVSVRTDDRVPFEKDDLLLAEELIGWAALSQDNARRYARERSAALALQRHLLPHHASGGSAAEVAWRYLPADSHRGVGGDWFDVIPLSGLRAAVRTLANLDLPLAALLARLDEQVIRLAETDAGLQDPAAATIASTRLYAVYGPVTRQCTIARTGHPPPAITDPHGGITFPDLPTGAPLGVGLVPFEATTLQIPDGLIETRDQDIDVGMDRLAAALARPPGPPLENLSSSVVDSLSACCDDITLLLARTRALGPDQVASWEFPADTSLVGSARALATAQLNQWGLEHLTDSTELIVSELVTNAIQHGSGPIRLRLIRNQVLTCEVHDTNSSSPRLNRSHANDESGRGLLLVDQLSRTWGTRPTPDGKLIWAEQPLTPSP